MSVRGEFWPSLAGDDGLEGNGEADGNGEWLIGKGVKRKIRASSCQNDLLLTKISFHPAGSLKLVSVPTQDSSLATNPMRSNFCIRFLPFKIPSRFILIRQSAFGLPASGVRVDASVMTCGLGGSLWKYQYNVDQSIRAICLVGEPLNLKSELEGMEMDDRNRESFRRVGLVNRCVIVCFVDNSSRGSRYSDILLRRGRRSSLSSTSSSVCNITVHPGGKAELCRSS